MEITTKRLGVTAVLDNDKLIGIITDGDLRRMLEKSNVLNSITAANILSVAPKTVHPDTMAVEALNMMRHFDISQLIVADEDRYLGILHIHDLIKEGII